LHNSTLSTDRLIMSETVNQRPRNAPKRRKQLEEAILEKASKFVPVETKVPSSKGLKGIFKHTPIAEIDPSLEYDPTMFEFETPAAKKKRKARHSEEQKQKRKAERKSQQLQ